MGRNRRFSGVVLLLTVGLMTASPLPTRSEVGVCYGTLGSDLPPPAEVVGLYQSLGIRRMRIYDCNQKILQALRGSDIELLLGLPGPIDYFAKNASAASEWIRKCLLAHSDAVGIRYIDVGNEMINSKNGGAERYVLPAMQNIYAAISGAGLQDQIKVSTALTYDVIGTSYPPSAGKFSDKAAPVVMPIVDFLRRTRAPLLVNVYPYFAYTGNPQEISLDYALFTAPTTMVNDSASGLGYQNLFDAMVDAAYAALEKAGANDVNIVVSETGWPTAGGDAATIKNAQTYNTNLVGHVVKGTPKKPGKAVETYIFAIFNENQKTPPGIENNWGLFYPNKTAVYRIRFNN